MTGIALGSAGPDSDKVIVDHVEVRMRGGSVSAGSRRASSLPTVGVGNLGGAPTSPSAFGHDLELAGDDFAFDGEIYVYIRSTWAHFSVVPANNSALDSQLSDFNHVNLERNSFNFLE